MGSPRDELGDESALHRQPKHGGPIAGTGEKGSSVDRQKVTPMYLKMYCRMGGHHQYALGSPRGPTMFA